MVSILFGILAVLGGLWGICNWSGDLIHFLKGLVPISLFFAGIIAIITGMSGPSKPSTSKKA
jgi:hypothetical protein